MKSFSLSCNSSSPPFLFRRRHQIDLSSRPDLYTGFAHEHRFQLDLLSSVFIPQLYPRFTITVHIARWHLLASSFSCFPTSTISSPRRENIPATQVMPARSSYSALYLCSMSSNPTKASSRQKVRAASSWVKEIAAPSMLKDVATSSTCSSPPWKV